MKSSSGNLWFIYAAMGAHFVSVTLFHLFFGSIIGISSLFCICDLPCAAPGGWASGEGDDRGCLS